MMAGPAGADARGLLGPCAVVDWLGDDGERDGGRHGGGGGGHGAAKRRTISPLASICATASDGADNGRRGGREKEEVELLHAAIARWRALAWK
jgi:hypothetical protein